jgi:hypothetical protein
MRTKEDLKKEYIIDDVYNLKFSEDVRIIKNDDWDRYEKIKREKRLNGTIWINWWKVDDNGNVILEEYSVHFYKDSNLHRINGPALIEENGVGYWLEGSLMDESDYWKKMYKLGYINEEELVLRAL